jgi:hypothetical protein
MQNKLAPATNKHYSNPALSHPLIDHISAKLSEHIQQTTLHAIKSICNW